MFNKATYLLTYLLSHTCTPLQCV